MPSTSMECFNPIPAADLGDRQFPQDSNHAISIANSNVVAFRTTLHQRKISFENVDRPWSKLLLENFLRTVKEARRANAFTPGVGYWSKVEKRLVGTSVTGRRNTDTRVSFRWDNVFLVKSKFTFGQRTVQAGTYHVLQLTYVPLLLYHSPHASAEKKDGLLEVEDQQRYVRTLLQPHETFVLKPGTVYVLMAYQKCLFTMDVLTSPVRGIDPTIQDIVPLEMTQEEMMYLVPASREMAQEEMMYLVPASLEMVQKEIVDPASREMVQKEMMVPASRELVPAQEEMMVPASREMVPLDIVKEETMDFSDDRYIDFSDLEFDEYNQSTENFTFMLPLDLSYPW